MSQRLPGQNTPPEQAGPAPAAEAAMDEALVEIDRLRTEVRHMRESLNDPLAAATASPEGDALERLERLRRSIARARAEREQAVAEFRDLVAPVRHARRGTAASAGPSAPASTASAQSGDSPAVVPAPPQATEAGPAAIAPSSEHDTAAFIGPALFAAHSTAPATRRWPWLLLWLPLALMAGGFVYWISRPPAPPPVVSGEVTLPAAPGAATEPPAPRSASSPASASAALVVQLRTVREAWVRVVVDGRRSLERLVPAGQSLTFSATTLVSVRAGDAGAVLVAVNGGTATPLGRDGQVAAQSFAAPDTAGLKPDDVR